MIAFPPIYLEDLTFPIVEVERQDTEDYHPSYKSMLLIICHLLTHKNMPAHKTYLSADSPC
jgi:hypothetical protein